MNEKIIERNRAEFKWRNDWHRYFLDYSNYSAAVETRDGLSLDILNAVTDAEMESSGEGLKLILSYMQQNV